jgi:hypothetical protein
VGSNGAKDRHDGIANVFLDETLVLGDDFGDLVEKSCKNFFDFFRVEALCQDRITGKIRKKNRYVLSLSHDAVGRCGPFDIGQRRPGRLLIGKKSIGFGQKLPALVAEVAFGKIHGVTARAEGTHPLSTFAAKFDTRRILVSTSRAFHGKLLSKAAESIDS